MNPQLFQNLKNKALKNRSEEVADRLKKLEIMADWIQKNEDLILQALQKDFKKPYFETQLSEIIPILSEIKFFLKNLKKWMKEKKVSTPMTLLGHSSRIRYENKGVVLIISPWNYPFQLAVGPLIAALAAGNTAVIKPSEVTTHTSILLQKMMIDCFSSDEVLVELGDKEKTQELLCYDFNHVFFTGSTEVGRIISKACAEKLIPVTLELGGKSPTIVDATADLKEACEKIYWGKFLNRGQTCVAPDYILIADEIHTQFTQQMKNIISTHENDEKASLINEKHSLRLQNLTRESSSENIQTNEKSLSLITNAGLDSKIMQEEIFGPVLPILKYKDEAELVSLLQKNNSPLALYIFSKNKNLIEKILNSLTSGGVGINCVLMQFGNHHLPFGGVGQSGVGRYHGYHGFLELSHQRAVIEQKFLPQLRALFMPPYSAKKYNLIKWAKKL